MVDLGFINCLYFIIVCSIINNVKIIEQSILSWFWRFKVTVVEFNNKPAIEAYAEALICRISTQLLGALLVSELQGLINMNYEWDNNKAVSNQRKHGILFSDATAVFED